MSLTLSGPRPEQRVWDRTSSVTPGHHQGTAVLPGQAGEQPPAPPGHGTSLPRLVLWGQISAGRGEAGEGWDTTRAQCLHPAPSNHRLVTPGWRQLGLQAGSRHSRFLPGCLGQERSLTASRHHPGRRAAARGLYGEAVVPKHSRATFPWADTAAPLGEWRHCGGAGRSGHAEGEAAGDARAGKAEQQPGPRSRGSTSARAERPTGTRLCRSRLPWPQEAVQAAPAGTAASKRRARTREAERR